MTRYRIGVFQDEDFVPTGCHGKPLPEPPEVYAQSPYCWADGSEMSYAYYLQRYGDPRQHIGAAVVVERLRPEDRDWEEITALHGVDLMDDTPEADVVPVGEYGEVRWYYPDSLPPGYLGEVARELLREAGYADSL